MTTRQKVWTWVGTGIGMGLCAVLGIGGAQLYGNQQASASTPNDGQFVTHSELHARVGETKSELVQELRDVKADLKELRASQDVLGRDLRAGQEAMHDQIADLRVDLAKTLRVRSETARTP